MIQSLSGDSQSVQRGGSGRMLSELTDRPLTMRVSLVTGHDWLAGLADGNT